MTMIARLPRNVVPTTLAAAAALVVSVCAWGQDYPVKVVREQNIKPG